MIYIIGDSHVSVFSGTDKGQNGDRHIQPEFGYCYTLKLGSLRAHNKFEQRVPYFCPIKIGSTTAYSSFKMIPVIERVIEEYGITQDDYIFTCYGEIDIRNHIGHHIGDGTIEDAIKNTVDKYIDTVLYLKDKGVNIGVYGPPASSVNAGYVKEYGNVVIRNNMTIMFNTYLGEKCLEYEIPFKDISKFMMLPDGTTDPKFIMDDIHLSQEIMPYLKEVFKTEIEKTKKYDKLNIKSTGNTKMD
jgi:hypothetical protein